MSIYIQRCLTDAVFIFIPWIYFNVLLYSNQQYAFCFIYNAFVEIVD